MTHRKPEPLSDRLRHSLRRQPVYTFPSVELAKLRAQYDAAMAGLRWNQEREREDQQRR